MHFDACWYSCPMRVKSRKLSFPEGHWCRRVFIAVIFFDYLIYFHSIAFCYSDCFRYSKLYISLWRLYCCLSSFFVVILRKTCEVPLVYRKLNQKQETLSWVAITIVTVQISSLISVHLHWRLKATNLRTSQTNCKWRRAVPIRQRTIYKLRP